MKATLFTLSPFAILAGSLLTSGLSAQSVIDQANESLQDEDTLLTFGAGQEAPMLNEDEFEDVGPQYLLTPGSAAHDWFRALLDIQWFNSTNPTLAEDNAKRSADLMVATAQVGVMTPERKIFDGQASLLAGFRYQNFEYGELTGDTEINGQPVSRNDFEGYTVFADGSWVKDNWKVSAGIRYTTLDNRVNGDDFYNELVVSWGAARNFSISKDALLTLSYDGAAYFTESEIGAFFFRDDFNDRLSNALGARLIYRINSKLFIQPSIRFDYSDYSEDPNGDREDLTTRVGATLSYYVKPNAVIRVFASYQTRDSNGVGISEYSNIDAGLGGSLSFKF